MSFLKPIPQKSNSFLDTRDPVKKTSKYKLKLRMKLSISTGLEKSISVKQN